LSVGDQCRRHFSQMGEMAVQAMVGRYRQSRVTLRCGGSCGIIKNGLPIRKLLPSDYSGAVAFAFTYRKDLAGETAGRCCSTSARAKTSTRTLRRLWRVSTDGGEGQGRTGGIRLWRQATADLPARPDRAARPRVASEDCRPGMALLERMLKGREWLAGPMKPQA
jgi:hypothetical protein